ncbi:MAG: cupin protein [Thermoleophilia bacterium]|nr:cupin protein [Thermoleophilia bacterium]
MADFTKTQLTDVTDMAPQYDMSQTLESRFATKPLGLEQLGLSYQCIKPGQRLPFTHHHEHQEELYVVQRGSGFLELDGERVPVTTLDAVRIAAQVERTVEAGPEGLDLLAIGAPAVSDGTNDAVMPTS